MKQFADNHRSERSFEVGSWVFLKLHPYVQTTLRIHKYSKLSPKYFGPFLILDKIGPAAYKLDLPPTSQIHHTFHLSLSKQANGPPNVVQQLPMGSNNELQPLQILERKLARQGNRPVVKFLIQWKDLPLHDTTWMNVDEFMVKFPTFPI
ncbi:uncharacterized protein LOC143596767 [Bidens hawaiensis]|uniref:uncharacterized protein LOC143596767 n=1 Tax=Bidens hawaiensis TaxID=980011 RepID=UPI00404B6D40